jgi:hypothetical protein
MAPESGREPLTAAKSLLWAERPSRRRNQVAHRAFVPAGIRAEAAQRGQGVDVGGFRHDAGGLAALSAAIGCTRSSGLHCDDIRYLPAVDHCAATEEHGPARPREAGRKHESRQEHESRLEHESRQETRKPAGNTKAGRKHESR